MKKTSLFHQTIKPVRFVFANLAVASAVLLATPGCHSIEQFTASHHQAEECGITNLSDIVACDTSSQKRRDTKVKHQKTKDKFQKNKGNKHLTRDANRCERQANRTQRKTERCELKDEPDFGKRATPAPIGTYVNGWTDAMICAGRRLDFVISRHEWFSGGEKLGPEGRIHVSKIAEKLNQHIDQRVIIESEPTHLVGSETLEEALERTSNLNESRRNQVVNILLTSGVTDAKKRVLLTPIDRVGVYGIEAPRVYNQILQGGFGGNGQRGGGNQRGGGGGFNGGGGRGF